MSSVQWGEVACLLYKRHGLLPMEASLADLLSAGVEVVAATPHRAVRSGVIKATRRIPYADCFSVELAGDCSDHVLLTADFDAKPAEADVRVEFLPVIPRSH
jgi:hypothetical protein